MNSRIVGEFVEVTGTTKAVAQKFLSRNNYNLNKSIDEYLGKKINSKLTKIFDAYKETPLQIGIDGTLEYIDALGIDAEDIRSLILSYFLESESMGVFTKEKFLTNWDQVEVLTVEGMKQHIEKLTRQIESDQAEFDKLYAFTFDFILESPTQKSISHEILIPYWKLLFTLVQISPGAAQRIDQWYAFITAQKRNINRDSYLMFWEFLKEVVLPEPEHLPAYDDMASWPVVIDEYVEHLQESGLLAPEPNTL